MINTMNKFDLGDLLLKMAVAQMPLIIDDSTNELSADPDNDEIVMLENELCSVGGAFEAFRQSRTKVFIMIDPSLSMISLTTHSPAII
jgi:hypothetical protein